MRRPREATLTGSCPRQKRRLGRRRATRHQAGDNRQDAQAQLAPTQPQAAPLHQVALPQQAALPQQQAQDHAGNVFFPCSNITTYCYSIAWNNSTVDTRLTSTCVDTGLTSTITSSNQPIPEPINSITVPIGCQVNKKSSRGNLSIWEHYW